MYKVNRGCFKNLLVFGLFAAGGFGDLGSVFATAECPGALGSQLSESAIDSALKAFEDKIKELDAAGSVAHDLYSKKFKAGIQLEEKIWGSDLSDSDRNILTVQADNIKHAGFEHLAESRSIKRAHLTEISKLASQLSLQDIGELKKRATFLADLKFFKRSEILSRVLVTHVKELKPTDKDKYLFYSKLTRDLVRASLEIGELKDEAMIALIQNLVDDKDLTDTQISSLFPLVYPMFHGEKPFDIFDLWSSEVGISLLLDILDKGRLDLFKYFASMLPDLLSLRIAKEISELTEERATSPQAVTYVVDGYYEFIARAYLQMLSRLGIKGNVLAMERVMFSLEGIKTAFRKVANSPVLKNSNVWIQDSERESLPIWIVKLNSLLVVGEARDYFDFMRVILFFGHAQTFKSRQFALNEDVLNFFLANVPPNWAEVYLAKDYPTVRGRAQAMLDTFWAIKAMFEEGTLDIVTFQQYQRLWKTVVYRGENLSHSVRRSSIGNASASVDVIMSESSVAQRLFSNDVIFYGREGTEAYRRKFAELIGFFEKTKN